MMYETNQIKFAAYALVFGAKLVKKEVRFDKIRKKKSVYFTLSHKDIAKLYDDYRREPFTINYYELKMSAQLLLKEENQ